jgi:hypothetical protein
VEKPRDGIIDEERKARDSVKDIQEDDHDSRQYRSRLHQTELPVGIISSFIRICGGKILCYQVR